MTRSSYGRPITWLAAAGVTLAVVACDDSTAPTLLEPPTALTAEAVSETQIDLSWSAASGATGYRVERRSGGAGFTELDDVSATAYSDMSLDPGTEYTYRVKSLGPDGAVSSATSEVSRLTLGEPRVDLVGNITATRTLSNDTTYVLKGTVQVHNGGKIVMPAGTTILGDKTTQGTLLILQGGIIDAQGTAADPIVFTSAQNAGSRAKGDWGGVIINGRSNCNFPAGECLGEGNTGAYGGSVPDDSSGVITYVRIEFGGIEFSPDNELNGLTLDGLGSRTVLHHIQLHAGLDDGIEWFGGTVDLKYAVVTDASDDSFDWSTGWQGRGQFWIVQQDPNDADNGWEIDNNEGDFEALPRTYAQIYNFTMVGKAAGSGSTGESTRGLLFRRGYAGVHSCGIVAGFGGAGLDIDDAATVRLANNDSLSLTRTIFFENGRDLAGGINNFDPDTDPEGGSTFEETWATDAGKNNQQVDPQLVAPYNRDDPDFSPASGSPALDAGCAPPADGFFTDVTYLGAVAGSGDTWYKGWTAFPKN